MSSACEGAFSSSDGESDDSKTVDSLRIDWERALHLSCNDVLFDDIMKRGEKVKIMYGLFENVFR